MMHSSLSFSEYEEKQEVPQCSINIEIPHASVRYEMQEPLHQRYVKTELSLDSKHRFPSTTSQSNHDQHHLSSAPNEPGFPSAAHTQGGPRKAYHEPVKHDISTVRAVSIAPATANATQIPFATTAAVNKQASPVISTAQALESQFVSCPAPKASVQPTVVEQSFPKTEQVESLQTESVLTVGLQRYETLAIRQSEALAVASASENQGPHPPCYYPEKTIISAHEKPVAPTEAEASAAANENKMPSFFPAIDDPLEQRELTDKSILQSDNLQGKNSALSDANSASTPEIIAEIQLEVPSSIDGETEAGIRGDIEVDRQLSKQKPSNIYELGSVHDSFRGLSDSMASSGTIFNSRDAFGREFSPLESRKTVDLTLNIVNSFDSSVSNTAMSSVGQLHQSQREADAGGITKSEAGSKSDPNVQIMVLNSVESLDGFEASQSATSADHDFGLSSVADMSSSPGRTDGGDQIKFFNASTDSISYSAAESDEQAGGNDRSSPLKNSPTDASRREDSVTIASSTIDSPDSKTPSYLPRDSDTAQAEKDPSENENRPIERSEHEAVQGSESSAQVALATEEKPAEEVLYLLSIWLHLCVHFVS